MKTNSGHAGKPAIDLLEEAVAQLRQCDAGTWLCYYAGTIPFILALLYFWSEMSAGAYAEESLGSAALGMAGAYLWMKCWQSVFVNRLLVLIGTQEPIRWTLGRIFRLIAQQSLVQSTALFAMPVAALVALPFGWTYAFYQSFLIHGNGEALPVRVLAGRSIEQSKLWPRQNHVGLGFLAVGFLVVFINALSLIGFAPGLVKTLLGIETIFSRTPFSLLNSTVLMIAWGGASLVLGPVAKAFYVLRSFYGRALGTGEDLRVAVRRLRAVGLGALSGLLLWTGGTTWAAEPRQLDESIDQVLARPEYAWRMPRAARAEAESANPTLLDKFSKAVKDAIKACLAPVKKWLTRFLDWLDRWMAPSRQKPESESGSGTDWKLAFKWGIIGLCGVILVAAGVVALRMWKQRSIQPQIAAEPVRAMPDLRSEHVTADELPEDQWIALAQRLASEGEYRLSLRALYLAGLAHLGRRELVTIARAKSNKEFRMELSRRARLQTELIEAFGESVRAFENVWYGTGVATPETLERYTANLQRIQTC